MKIQFDSELDYQQDAIKSVVKLFEGQETRQSHFTVPSISTTAQKDIFGNQNDLGVGNNLRIVEEDVLDNVKAINYAMVLNNLTNWIQWTSLLKWKQGLVRPMFIYVPFLS
ncbi:hypothetical protein BMR03_14470 [Methylococcaceae bacterium HT2]|nr:hypothetical protein BMR03_14470 [Methylococcaceae bacterium HT2]